MINEFTSSAIEALSTNDDGQILVTFTGGRQYTYGVADVMAFATAFNAAASKGRFVNQEIKAEGTATALTSVAV